MRFGFNIKNEVIEQLCDKWTTGSRKNVVFGIENDDLELVAVAHISLESEPAELAFSVIKNYQGRGMGDALMKRAIEYCQNHNIKQGCMVCLSTNDKIKRLAKRNNVLVTSLDGDAQAEILIPDPNPVSVWKEYWEDHFAKLDHLGKAQRKLARMFRFPLQF